MRSRTRLLNGLDMRYLLGAKPGEQAEMLRWVGSDSATRRFEMVGGDGTRWRVRYLNGAPLNNASFDLDVNFLECREAGTDGEEQRFVWVADMETNESEAFVLMRAARARWRMENEIFNMLKNQGYGSGHNYRHGERHLATVFAMLTMLGFVAD